MCMCILECGNGIHRSMHVHMIHNPSPYSLQRSVAGGRCLVSHTSATSSENHSSYLNLKSRCVTYGFVCLRVHLALRCVSALLCLSRVNMYVYSSYGW